MELEDHVPVYIPEPEHPEDLVPAKDEAPTPPLPPFFLSPCIRPPHTRAAMAHMRATALSPDNYDNESSDDDNDDDDVEKDEEDKEGEEHLAPVDPPTVPAGITEFAAALPSSSPPPKNVESHKDNIRETMTTVDQGMSVEKIERVVAQRVANAIEAIVIYETKTNMARKSISQTEQQECKVAENANNKRKWEGNHNGQCTIKGGNCKKAENKRKLNNTSQNNQNQQQPNKRQNTSKAYATGHGEKKYYGGSKPLCPKCNYHHDGPCAPKATELGSFDAIISIDWLAKYQAVIVCAEKIVASPGEMKP
ncbi:hypothetical protein Tco_1285564 [Tanacetum coccineum]